MGGDFNVVLGPNECLGTSPPLLPSQEFADMVSDCGLCDLPFIGSIYTWCQPSLSLIRKLPDHVLVNPAWLAFFGSLLSIFTRPSLTILLCLSKLTF